MSLEGKIGWVVYADFLLGVTCACVLVEGDQVDQAGNYRNSGKHTHTSTHTVITKWSKEKNTVDWFGEWKTKSDIDQSKAELTLSLETAWAECQLGNTAKRAQQFNLQG